MVNQDQRRKGHDDVGQPHQKAIDKSTVIPGNGAQTDAKHGIEQYRHNADRERNARPIDQPAKDIAPGRVGAQPMFSRRWFAIGAQIDTIGILLRYPRGKERQRGQYHQNETTQQRQLMLAKA